MRLQVFADENGTSDIKPHNKNEKIYKKMDDGDDDDDMRTLLTNIGHLLM